MPQPVQTRPWRRALAAAGGLLAAGLLSAAALAIINPKLTPVHLVRDSELVLHGALGAGATDDEWVLKGATVLKGKAHGPQALGAASFREEQRDELRQLLKPEAGAVLFARRVAPDRTKAFVHVGGRWISAEGAGPGAWHLIAFDQAMDGTYAGGADMLAKMSRYLIEDPGASVPPSAGLAWSEWIPVTRLDGAIAGLASVQIGGKRHLWAASPAGDRLFAPVAREGGEAMTEITADVGLDTRSRQYAWRCGRKALCMHRRRSRRRRVRGRVAAARAAGPALVRARGGIRGADGVARPLCGRQGPVRPGGFRRRRFPRHLRGGADGNELWENDGKAGFRAVLAHSGSLGYKADSRVSAALAADLNHDGRPDLALGSADAGFVYHFSRGYRCFGEQGELRLNEVPEVPNLPSWGVQAMAVGDFNDDDADDLAVAFAGGEIHCYYSGLVNVAGCRVSLANRAAGPVTVSAWQGAAFPVCTGTWTVNRPDEAVRFSVRHRGNCVLKYTLPGKPAATRTLQVGLGLATVVLE